jgi:hypothetical protein
MIVKKTKQLGNFKKGINLYFPKKRIVSPAPSGIVVATTNAINVADTFGYIGTVNLSKSSSTLYSTSVNFSYGQAFCAASSEYVSVEIAAIKLIKESGYWIYRYEGLYYCNDNNEAQNFNISDVLEVTSGIIPTTGWSNSLTITAV